MNKSLRLGMLVASFLFMGNAPQPSSPSTCISHTVTPERSLRVSLAKNTLNNNLSLMNQRLDYCRTQFVTKDPTLQKLCNTLHHRGSANFLRKSLKNNTLNGKLVDVHCNLPLNSHLLPAYTYKVSTPDLIIDGKKSPYLHITVCSIKDGVTKKGVPLVGRTISLSPHKGNRYNLLGAAFSSSHISSFVLSPFLLSQEINYFNDTATILPSQEVPSDILGNVQAAYDRAVEEKLKKSSWSVKLGYNFTRGKLALAEHAITAGSFSAYDTSLTERCRLAQKYLHTALHLFLNDYFTNSMPSSSSMASLRRSPNLCPSP